MFANKQSRVREETRERALKLAIISVKFGRSIRAAALEYGLPRSTLSRHCRLNVGIPIVESPTESTISLDSVKLSKRGRPPVFSEEREHSLAKYCLTCADKYLGLTSKEVRVLAQQLASKLQIPMPQNWCDGEICGMVWFRNFIRRHPSLSLRLPEPTSLARVAAFNPIKVGSFFSLLQTVASQMTYEPNSIWNLDETGVTIVHTPQRVVARRGLKRVGKITSADRGQMITMALAVSAVGNKMPPFFIFPNKRFHPYFLNGDPVGCTGTCSPSGWMNAETFLQFLKHFVDHTRVTVKHPLLLILDNHESHRSLEAIEYCAANGIHLLTIPPHCSHRLQPLDVSIFSPFKRHLNTVCDTRINLQPGTPITVLELPALVSAALDHSASVANITAGFRASGIWPLNPNIFTATDYMPSSVTDKPPPMPSEMLSKASTSQNFPASQSLEDILLALRPIPQAPPRKAGTRGRKPGKAEILTDSGNIEALRQTMQAKAAAALRVKRPRGRPRKASPTQPNSATSQAKRPVGRPRKQL